MQLGQRWRVGTPAPKLSPQILDQIQKYEEQLLSQEGSSALSWTLTWLEGKAIVQCDDGFVIHSPGSIMLES